jgi:hypothetical protein
LNPDERNRDFADSASNGTAQMTKDGR